MAFGRRRAGRSATAASRNSNAFGEEQVQPDLGELVAFGSDLICCLDDVLFPFKESLDWDLAETLANAQRECTPR